MVGVERIVSAKPNVEALGEGAVTFVIPAHAGIQPLPRLVIPAQAGIPVFAFDVVEKHYQQRLDSSLRWNDEQEQRRAQQLVRRFPRRQAILPPS
jgi:hypothetical protein